MSTDGSGKSAFLAKYKSRGPYQCFLVDHRLSEELYLVSSGRGRLVIDGEERIISEGDCALIPPGTRHKVFNVGAEPLRLVCASSPAYSDEDTCLTE
jgi:mannose-6-phosphate isomerase-like protein (cupin superfamily)